jgi:hypothetical protein
MDLVGEDVGAAGGGGEAAWSGGDGAGGEEGGDESSRADGRTTSGLIHHATYGRVPAHLSGLARVRAEQ